jgi:RND superfamily putative drug exporter
MPSVVGQKLLDEAFPFDRAKSQIAVYLAREDRPLDQDDIDVGYDLARRLKNLQGVAAWTRHRELLAREQQLRAGGEVEQADAAGLRADKALGSALAALDEAIRLDQLLAEHWDKRLSAGGDEAPAARAAQRPARLAAAWFNRSLVREQQGDRDGAATDRQLAVEWDPALAEHPEQLIPAEAQQLPLLDTWTWKDDVFGKKLQTKHTRLMILQLSTEFMATENIGVLDYLETVLEAVREEIPPSQQGPLQIGFSGSAAVGGDLLRSAKESIENTELFTVILVVLILGFVYRSPMLVAMPLITIVVSLLVATSVIAMLTQLHHVPGFAWWDFKVFTTTRIFIVVILFGAGTDYFLFLASRYREELESGHDHREGVARALAGVGDALAASALTTILGLAMMFFAEFGKFSNSGPAIGLCLAITLLACVTLAPALLRALGPLVFWPFGMPRRKGSGDARNPSGWFTWLWRRVARWVVRYDAAILAGCVLLLAYPAYHGLSAGGNVTYDFLRQLPDDRPSKRGAELMARHFAVGESGPLIVVAHQPGGDFDTRESRERIGELGERLYVDGVTAVRSIADPLGDFPPGKRVGLFNMQSWRKLAASPHPRTQEIFVATEGEYAGEVTHLDLVLDTDPFSVRAEQVLDRIEQTLESIRNQPDSPWSDTTFAFAGIAAGIRDLKQVTQADNIRIQVLVVAAVLTILLLILRRPLICLYMIATVLFSYFVTIGTTEWFFAWVDGEQFQGLDWKVPLFLFVILVAVGQDYNVYLATRVFEEQERRGPLKGLEVAVVRTGGIITSCGIIMAGTFLSMTSGTWGQILGTIFPATRGFWGPGGALPAIVQLGFALSLGVLLDTFVVRPILVPAFLSILVRWRRETTGKPTVRPD